jgi:uncharacterized protein
MSFDILAKAIIGILFTPGLKSIDFVWHGGEATLLGTKFYNQALWLQRSFNMFGVQLRNSIQTNGVMLSEDWIEFLFENNFGLGISVDGPPELHDQYRRDIRHRATSERLYSSISRLKERAVPFGFLLVVTRDTLKAGAKRILAWLGEVEVTQLSVLNSLPSNQTPPHDVLNHYLPFEEYVDFLRTLFSEWHDHHKGKIEIRELESLINNLSGKPSILCVHEGRCMGQFITVDPDGTVSACDKFIGDPHYVFGEIGGRPILEVIKTSELLARSADLANNQSDQYERACEFGHVCRGGCPHDSYLLERFGLPRTKNCCGLGPLLRDMSGKGYGQPHPPS